MSLFPIGRKAKDKKALAQANERGGSVVIRSNNKIGNPENPGQTLGRGSTVTVTKTPRLEIDKPKVIPGKSHTIIKKESHDSFVSGDVSPMSNFRHKDTNIGHMDSGMTRIDKKSSVQERETHPHMGSLQHENPAKTQARIDAQSKGQTSYDFKGKKEYSGRVEKVTRHEAVTTKDPDTIEMSPARMKVDSQTIVKPVGPGREVKPKGHSSITLTRSAGSDRKGRPQNYMNLKKTNKAGENKTLLRVKTFTPGTKGRTGSTVLPRRKY